MPTGQLCNCPHTFGLVDAPPSLGRLSMCITRCQGARLPAPRAQAVPQAPTETIGAYQRYVDHSSRRGHVVFVLAGKASLMPLGSWSQPRVQPKGGLVANWARGPPLLHRVLSRVVVLDLIACLPLKNERELQKHVFFCRALNSRQVENHLTSGEG